MYLGRIRDFKPLQTVKPDLAHRFLFPDGKSGLSQMDDNSWAKYKKSKKKFSLSSQIHDITSDNLNYALEHMGTVNQTSQNNSNFYTSPPSTRQFQSSSSSSSSSTSSSTSHILPI